VQQTASFSNVIDRFMEVLNDL